MQLIKSFIIFEKAAAKVDNSTSSELYVHKINKFSTLSNKLMHNNVLLFMLLIKSLMCFLKAVFGFFKGHFAENNRHLGNS